MKTINTSIELEKAITLERKQGKTIGFVPTMGALHKGHYALLQKAREACDCLVCSIFVNPTQFNNSDDLKKYPRNIEKDIAFIDSLCDIIFLPSVEEMYPFPPTDTYDFGDLDKVMEGAFRPGHFNGVAMVVRRFFDMVKPDRAYFGKKDYQQAAIIKKLVGLKNYPIHIELVDTVRESDGLAFSSRNSLLSIEKRKEAPFIYQTLSQAEAFINNKQPQEIKQWVINRFKSNPHFELEYVEVVDAENLHILERIDPSRKGVICLAAWLDNVRLIDNIEFNN